MKWLSGPWHWLDDRAGVSSIWRVLFKHPVPASLTGKSGWFYVLGTATLTVFIIQVVTGIALATSYIPSTAHAYDSLNFITNQATLGKVLRGMHYFGASAMVILVAAHMGRVILTGSYKFPRELNWLSGVVLLALVFGMAFTGQLLRWDEDAIGSTLVAAEQASRLPLIGHPLAHLILAGKSIGGATLSRFYAVHVFLLPGIIFGALGLHLLLVIKHGISEPPQTGQPVDKKTYRQRYERLLHSGHFYFPDAFWREAVFGVLVIVVILALAVFVGPKSLGAPPDPTNTQSNPRPDWYLLWAFALLAVLPKQIEDWFIVLAPPIAIIGLLLVPIIGSQGERSPARRPWAVAGIVIALMGVITLLQTGIKSPWAPHFDTQPLSAQVLGTSSGSAYDGSQLFFNYGCQYCHGVVGRGGERGPDLTHVRSRLSRDDVKARILAAPPNMPSFAGKISNGDLEKLVDFLEYVDKEPVSAAGR